MVELDKLQKGEENLFLIRISGKLSEREYRVAFPQIESDLGSHRNLLVLFDLRELEGWASGTRWKSLKFSSRHLTDIRRVGVVGEYRWERWIRSACRPLKSPVRSFDSYDDALEWLLQESIPDLKT